MLGGELPIASCVQGVPGEVPIKTQLPRWIRSHSQKLKGNLLTYILTNNIFTDILLSWEENYRHLVVYKESQEKAKKDPKLDEWTGTWRDSRQVYFEDGLWTLLQPQEIQV